MLSAHGGLRRRGPELLISQVLEKNNEIELRVLALCYPERLASGSDCGGGHYANAFFLYLLSPSLPLSLFRCLSSPATPVALVRCIILLVSLCVFFSSSLVPKLHTLYKNRILCFFPSLLSLFL